MIKLTSWPLFSVLLLTMVLNACNNSEENPADRSSPDSNAASGTKRFELLSAEQSGISFRNEITESRYINYFDYGYTRPSVISRGIVPQGEASIIQGHPTTVAEEMEEVPRPAESERERVSERSE